MYTKESRKTADAGTSRPASGRKTKWATKMKEKLKAALQNEPIPIDGDTANLNNGSKKPANGWNDGLVHKANGSANRRKPKRKNKAATSNSTGKEQNVDAKSSSQDASKIRINKTVQKKKINNNSKQSQNITNSEKVSAKGTPKMNEDARNPKKSHIKIAATTNNSVDELKPTASESITNRSNVKRKVATDAANPVNGEFKRFKLSSGFIESNANDDGETERVRHLLQEKKSKRKSADKINASGPPVVVHSVPRLLSSENESNSETEDYINKFFGNDSDDEGNRTSENQRCSNNDVNVIVNHTGMNVRENNYNDENDEFDANDSEDSYDSEESYEENRSCSEQNSSENDSDDDDIDIIDTDTEYDTDSESCSDDDGWEYSDNGSDCGSYSDCDDSDCSSYGSLGSEIQSDCSYSCSGRNGENYDSADDSDYAGTQSSLTHFSNCFKVEKILFFSFHKLYLLNNIWATLKIE